MGANATDLAMSTLKLLFEDDPSDLSSCLLYNPSV